MYLATTLRGFYYALRILQFLLAFVGLVLAGVMLHQFQSSLGCNVPDALKYNFACVSRQHRSANLSTALSEQLSSNIVGPAHLTHPGPSDDPGWTGGH